MYQDKEEKTRETLVQRITQIDTQLDQVERKVDELATRLQALNDVVNELKLREIARSQNGSPPLTQC